MEEEEEMEMRGKYDEDDDFGNNQNDAESEELEEARGIHSEDEDEDDEDQEQDQDDGEDDEDEEEDDDKETAAQLRESLASVPFEVIQALKKKGDARAPDRRNDPTPAGEEEKKRGKNQPMEASSKRRPPRFIDFGTIPKKNTQRKSRDPRFDSLSGKFNEDLFHKSYSFVEDYKQEELNELNEQLRKEKDPEEKERISLGIRLLRNQIAVNKRDEEQKTKKTARKKMERELVLQGKKPFYTKKSDEKTLELLEKFTDLKQKGQLDKYLVKKKRRNAAREHTRIPWRRRTAGDGDE